MDCDIQYDTLSNFKVQINYRKSNQWIMVTDWLKQLYHVCGNMSGGCVAWCTINCQIHIKKKKTFRFFKASVMAASSGIVVRKATEEDYQAVLDITSEFNNGADYLNVQYSELINDPDSSYYVCEVDGEVVSCFPHMFICICTCSQAG